MGVTELFCHVDDFWKQQSAHSHPARMRQLCESEIMTVLILFHESHYPTFKAFYTEYVRIHLRAEFPAWRATRALWSTCRLCCCHCAANCDVALAPVPASLL